MKKIYTLIAVAAIAFNSSAQTVEGPQHFVVKAIPYTMSATRAITNPDTTGLVNVTDFLPAFDVTAPTFYSYGSATLTTGYLYGNNGSLNGFKQVAQGYLNVNPTPVKVIGALMWFGGKQSDLGSSVTSKVVVNSYDMAANKAYNINAGAFNSSVLNFIGPNIVRASADILYADIDTINFNYVSFSAPQTFVGDFAIGVDFSTLAPGDTAGLVSDDINSALEQDYAYHKTATKWFVTDELFSGAAATGLFDNNIALWAVISDATGVNEFFNGMKLTTYPNPAVNNVTVEYTLEKNASAVSLVIFDKSGRKISENNYSNQNAGTYTVKVDASKFAAGTYFYQLNAGGHNFTKQLVITK
ncbi:MAG: T9SS type A sorting domain-containing protein [Bacteroidetes bacterium]|nr:T9SS type A sorting domain-containing protein [Bacteroidota bacterium]